MMGDLIPIATKSKKKRERNHYEDESNIKIVLLSAAAGV